MPVQFKSAGIVLFVRPGVVAMHPRCCRCKRTICVCLCTRFSEIYSQTDPVTTLCATFTFPGTCPQTITEDMTISAPPPGYAGCEAFKTVALTPSDFESGIDVYLVCEGSTLRLIALRGDASSNCHFVEEGVINTSQCTGTFSATGTLTIEGHAPLGACACDGDTVSVSIAEGACP